MSALDPLVVRWLGRVDYAAGLRIQEELVDERRRGRVPDTLLLLEHPPVITRGRASRSEHVLAGPAELRARGIGLHEAGRGGDVTYHGPGQLVGYPILALRDDHRDAHRYLRSLERALIATAACFGVEATRQAGRTGVWAAGRKLAAIGVRISSGWITSHGFAFNVVTDLSAFGAIVPCGIRDAGVTSLAELTGRRFALPEVASVAALELARALSRRACASPTATERLPVSGATAAGIEVGR
jgi:lipoyl(octanoyl) transferase